MKYNITQGLGATRKAMDGYKLALLYIEIPDIAQMLLYALTRVSQQCKIYIDIPGSNENVNQIVQKLHLQGPTF